MNNRQIKKKTLKKIEKSISTEIINMKPDDILVIRVDPKVMNTMGSSMVKRILKNISNNISHRVVFTTKDTDIKTISTEVTKNE